METVQELWKLGTDYFHMRGIPMVSYHHVPPPGAPDSTEILVAADGFPQGWVDRYIRHRMYDFDPIPDLALERADPYRWSETSQLITLTQDQKRYLEELRNAELGDGLAVPVYGPGGRNGYVGLGFGSPESAEANLPRLKDIQWVCQATHLKYCSLIKDQQPQQTALSPREREILQWVARGKSNTDISTITGISSNTVDTYMRRIYQKLRVSDRVTAAIRGVGSGLIRA